MKTAEEWVVDFMEARGFNSLKEKQEWVRQIQLESIKHGMTLAATIAVEHCLPGGYTDSPTDIAASQAGDRIGQEILTARDKLKEIPK